MQLKLKTLALLGVTLGLGACSTCVQERPHNGEPYTQSKTAGSRQAIFGSACKTEVEVQETVVRTPAKEPMVQHVEPVFREMQQK